MDQELLVEASELERYTSNLEQHNDYLTRQISELEQFNLYLESLIKISEKTILSSLGKGVYLKTEIAEKKLFVEVGAGVIVRKDPEELKVVVEDQITKLKESKIALVSQIEFYTRKLQGMLMELEKTRSS